LDGPPAFSGPRVGEDVGQFEKRILFKGPISLVNSSGSMFPMSGQLKERDFEEFFCDDDLGLPGDYFNQMLWRGVVQFGPEIGLGEETGHKASVGSCAQLEVDGRSAV